MSLSGKRHTLAYAGMRWRGAESPLYLFSGLMKDERYQFDELDDRILSSIRDWEDFLIHRKGARSSDISREIEAPRPTVKYRIDQLVTLALIVPHGGGQAEYTLTPAGRREAAIAPRRLTQSA